MRLALRKIVMWLSVSLDGFFEDLDGSLDWNVVDDELLGHMNTELSRTGGFLEGRRTYELMAAAWPTAEGNPDMTATEAGFAPIWLAMPKVVYSRTLESAGWNTTIARSVVPEEVRALQESAAGDLVVGG